MGILHITPGRSGSTFITQILQQLYGYHNVQATHGFVEAGDRLVVLTIRDFRDVLVSWWRTHSNLLPEDLEGGRKMTKEEIIKFTKNVSITVDGLNKTADANPHALILRYRNFYPNNWEYLFSQLEIFFGPIPEAHKTDVKDRFTFEQNIQRQKKYKYFGEHVDNDGIHGNHIYKGKIGGWKDLIEPEDYDLATEGFRDSLKRWGYIE